MPKKETFDFRLQSVAHGCLCLSSLTLLGRQGYKITKETFRLMLISDLYFVVPSSLVCFTKLHYV